MSNKKIAYISKQKKLLALDVGSFYIGFALSTDINQKQVLAIPYAVCEWKGNENIFLNMFREILKSENIVKIIIGYSYLLDGSDPKLSNQNIKSTDAIQKIEEIVQKETNIEIVFVDEKVSTIEAENRLADMIEDNIKLKSMRKDAIAAQIILERYLNS